MYGLREEINKKQEEREKIFGRWKKGFEEREERQEKCQRRESYGVFPKNKKREIIKSGFYFHCCFIKMEPYLFFLNSSSKHISFKFLKKKTGKTENHNDSEHTLNLNILGA